MNTNLKSAYLDAIKKAEAKTIRIESTLYALYMMLMNMLFDNELTVLNVKRAFNAYYDAMHTTLCLDCKVSDIDTEIENTVRIVNNIMLDKRNDFYVEFDADSAKFECKKTFHIYTLYKRNIKATYNIDAYINQYTDFYSNI